MSSFLAPSVSRLYLTQHATNKRTGRRVREGTETRDGNKEGGLGGVVGGETHFLGVD